MLWNLSFQPVAADGLPGGLDLRVPGTLSRPLTWGIRSELVAPHADRRVRTHDRRARRTGATTCAGAAIRPEVA